MTCILKILSRLTSGTLLLNEINIPKITKLVKHPRCYEDNEKLLPIVFLRYPHPVAIIICSIVGDLRIEKQILRKCERK